MDAIQCPQGTGHTKRWVTVTGTRWPEGAGRGAWGRRGSEQAQVSPPESSSALSYPITQDPSGGELPHPLPTKSPVRPRQPGGGEETTDP